MKEVQVRKHGHRDVNGDLTEKGKQQAVQLGKELGTFGKIISSSMERAQETARALTGEEPIVDMRASAVRFDEEEEREMFRRGQSHPLGIVGIIFEDSYYRARIVARGRELLELIQETLLSLPDDGKALIISHDGLMIAAEKLLKHESLERVDKNYEPLQGYSVNELLEVIALVR